jgi:hypothetical protein
MLLLHNTTDKRTKQQEFNQPNKPPPSSNQTDSKTNTYPSEKKAKVELENGRCFDPIDQRMNYQQRHHPQS